jgi:hypothetical protein
MEPITSLAVCSCNHLKAALLRRISGVRLVNAYSTSRRSECVSVWLVRLCFHELTICSKILQYHTLHGKLVQIGIQQGEDTVWDGILLRSHIDVGVVGDGKPMSHAAGWKMIRFHE